MPPNRLVYVTSRWGEPTQTFVRREAAAVVEAGVDVRALSIKKPSPGADRVPVATLSGWRLAVGVAKGLGRRPRGVCNIIGAVLRATSPRTVLPQMAAALVGVGWFGAGLVRDDHLHAHFGWVNATATWAAASLAGVPYSIVFHAFELHRGDLSDRLSTTTARGASAVFVIAEGDRGLVRARYGVEPELLRMGVPAAWLDVRPLPHTGQLVSVGSLVPKKGHDVLLRAVAAAHDHWKVTIVGEGSEEASLRALASELGIAGRVRFTGRLSESEVQACLRTATVFCLASVVDARGDRDGVPVALMEAMALGVPVVSTDVGGIPELVAGAGLIVPAGDHTAFARALDQLADPDERDLAGRRCRARIEDGWLVEDNVAVVAALAR